MRSTQLINLLDPDSNKKIVDKLAKNRAMLKENLNALHDNSGKESQEKIKNILKIIDSEFQICDDAANRLKSGSKKSPTRKYFVDIFFKDIEDKKKNEGLAQESHINYLQVKPRTKDAEKKKRFTKQQKKLSLTSMKNYLEQKTEFLDSTINLTKYLYYGQIILNEIATAEPNKVPALIAELEKTLADFHASKNTPIFDFAKEVKSNKKEKPGEEEKLSLHKMEKFSAQEDYKGRIIDEQMQRLEKVTKPFLHTDKMVTTSTIKTAATGTPSKTTTTTTTTTPALSVTEQKEPVKRTTVRPINTQLNSTLFAGNNNQRTESSKRPTKFASSLADSLEQPRRNLPSRSKSSRDLDAGPHLAAESRSPRSKPPTRAQKTVSQQPSPRSKPPTREQKTVSVQPSPRPTTARNNASASGLFSPHTSKTNRKEMENKLPEKTSRRHRNGGR